MSTMIGILVGPGAMAAAPAATPPAGVAPSAAGSLPDLVLTQGVAMTPADLSVGISGTAPITYALAPLSAALPSGLSLSAAGLLSGTALTTTLSPLIISVRATNPHGYVDRAFELTVQEAGATFHAARGATFRKDVAATYDVAADVPNATGLALTSGSLPTGMSISGTTVTGTPTAAGRVDPVLTVTRSSGDPVVLPVPFRVIEPVSSLTTREGMTLTFSAPVYAAEFTVDEVSIGGVWVDETHAITAATPAWNGSHNGMTLDPILRGEVAVTQGWTIRGAFGTSGGIAGNYSAAKNVDPAVGGNLTIPVNNYATKYIDNGSTDPNAARFGCGAYIPVFSVPLASLPPPDALRKPMYLTAAERGTFPWITARHLDVAGLPNHTAPAGSLSWTASRNSIPGIAPMDNMEATGTEGLVPVPKAGDGQQSWQWPVGGHYLGVRSLIMADAAARLLTSGSVAEKRAVAARLIQIGLDAYGRTTRNASDGIGAPKFPLNAGGHNLGYFEAMMLAGQLIGGSPATEAARALIRARSALTSYGVAAQVVRVNSAMVDAQPWPLGTAAGHTSTADPDRDVQAPRPHHVGGVHATERAAPYTDISIAPSGPYIEQNTGTATAWSVILLNLPDVATMLADPGKLRHLIDWYMQLDQCDGWGNYKPLATARGLVLSLYATPQLGQVPRRMEPLDWDVLVGNVDGEIVIDIGTIPRGAGDPITAIQWTIDGGATVNTLKDVLEQPIYKFSAAGAASLKEPSPGVFWASRTKYDFGGGLQDAGWRYNGSPTGPNVYEFVSSLPNVATQITDTLPDRVALNGEGRPGYTWWTTPRVVGGKVARSLTPATPYNVQIRAVNAYGPAAEWSEPKTVWALGPNNGKITATRVSAVETDNTLSISAGSVQPGDLIVAIIALRSGLSIPAGNIPAGWTTIASRQGVVGTPMLVLGREVTEAGSVTLSMTTTGGSFDAHAAVLWRLRHADGVYLEAKASAITGATTTNQLLPTVSHDASAALIHAIALNGASGGSITYVDPGTPALPGAWANGQTSGRPAQVYGTGTSPRIADMLVAGGGVPGTSYVYTATTTNTSSTAVTVAVSEMGARAPVITALSLPLAFEGAQIAPIFTWTGYPRTGVTYQWTRNGVNIGGATSATYTLVPADVGTQIRCVISIDNGVGTTTQTSAPVTVASAEDVVVFTASAAVMPGGAAVSNLALTGLSVPAGRRVIICYAQLGISTLDTVVSVHLGGQPMALAVPSVAFDTNLSRLRFYSVIAPEAGFTDPTLSINHTIASGEDTRVFAGCWVLPAARTGAATAVGSDDSEAHSVSGSASVNAIWLSAYFGYGTTPRTATGVAFGGPGSTSTAKSFALPGSTAVAALAHSGSVAAGSYEVTAALEGQATLAKPVLAVIQIP